MSTTRLVASSHNLNGADAGRRSRLATSRPMNQCRFADSGSMTYVKARQSIRTMDVTVRSSVDPVPHLPSGPPSGSWKFWVLGVLLSVILPFWRNKLGPLWKILNKVEAVVERAEDVIEFAEDAGKEVAKHLPNGKLKDRVNEVETWLEKMDKQAHQLGDDIHKVEEGVKAGDSFVKPNSDYKQAGEISEGTDE